MIALHDRAEFALLDAASYIQPFRTGYRDECASVCRRRFRIAGGLDHTVHICRDHAFIQGFLRLIDPDLGLSSVQFQVAEPVFGFPPGLCQLITGIGDIFRQDLTSF